MKYRFRKKKLINSALQLKMISAFLFLSCIPVLISCVSFLRIGRKTLLVSYRKELTISPINSPTAIMKNKLHSTLAFIVKLLRHIKSRI